MTSPVFDPRKEVIRLKDSLEDQIRESMATIMSSKKAIIRQKFKEKALNQQTQEVKNQPTLKELQVKVYLFPNSDM